MRAGALPRHAFSPSRRPASTSPSPSAAKSNLKASRISSSDRKSELSSLSAKKRGLDDKAVKEPRDQTSAESSVNLESLPWLTERLPAGFWNDLANQRRYVDWLGQKLGYKSREDWYNVTLKAFISNRGDGLLLKYHKSYSTVLSTLYTDHVFLPWLFVKAPNGLFKSRANRERYVSWLMDKVGVKKPEDLKYHNFVDHRGAGLLAEYGGSPQRVLDSLDPAKDVTLDELIGDSNSQLDDNGEGQGGSGAKQEKALEMKFKPQRFWMSDANQREFLDRVGAALGVKGGDLSPWYTVDQATLKRLGCLSLLTIHGGSWYKALKKVYPEYDWIPWKFKRMPHGLGRQPEIVEKAVGFIQVQRQIARPEQWYSVSTGQLREMGLYGLIFRAGGLYQVLKQYRPNYPWDEAKFQEG